MKTIDLENPPTGFSVKFGDRSFQDRVRRCAKFDRKTVNQLCWAAIADYVRCAEEDDMILAGEQVVGSRFDLPRNGVEMN